jgi:protein gp37
MSDKTGIEWTDATWNPTTGCDKVSPGCDHCYAMTLAKRLKAMHSPRYQVDGNPATSGPGFGFQMHADALAQPLRWTRPRRIFVNSMSDLFHSDMDVDFLARVFAVMATARQHTFQVLTKRPGRMRSLLSNEDFEVAVDAHARELGFEGYFGLPLPNVWLGTSVEDQKRADLRLRVLLGTPAAVRFLSCEPLLGPVDLAHAIEPDFAVSGWKDLGRLDWVIVGGESGPGARPMHPGWARSLRDQCTNAGVAFHFKQWGSFAPVPSELAEHGDVWVLGRGYASMVTPLQGEIGTMPTQPWEPGTAGAEPGRWDPYGDTLMRPMHKKAAGRELDGRTWDEYPPVVTA